jgi:hypothetical protein
VAAATTEVPNGQGRSQHEVVVLAFPPGRVGIVADEADFCSKICKFSSQDLAEAEFLSDLECAGLSDACEEESCYEVPRKAAAIRSDPSPGSGSKSPTGATLPHYLFSTFPRLAGSHMRVSELAGAGSAA